MWFCAWAPWTLLAPDIRFTIYQESNFLEKNLFIVFGVKLRILLHFPVGGSAYLFLDLVLGIWRIRLHIEVLYYWVMLALSIIIIYLKKFIHSDWLRAVQFVFLKQCRKELTQCKKRKQTKHSDWSMIRETHTWPIKSFVFKSSARPG